MMKLAVKWKNFVTVKNKMLKSIEFIFMVKDMGIFNFQGKHIFFY